MDADSSGEGPARARHRGRHAEELAAAFLQLKGLRLLDRNRRAGGGEVDLLVREGDCLVFVEVRLRRAGSWVGPGASIGQDKSRRLRACARELLRRREDLRWPGRTLRFDVIAMVAGADSLRLEHLKGVRLP